MKMIREKINKHRDFQELGYRLLRRYRGLGIATEAALASLEYGLYYLQPDMIYVMANTDNTGPDKVLRKCRLSLSDRFEHEGLVPNWYGICKTGWSQRIQ